MNLKTLISILIAILAMQISVAAQSAEAQITQAKDLIEKQDYPAAVVILNRVIAANPKNAAAHAQRARLNVRQNKYEQAFADAEKCLAIDPKNVDALNVRGVAFREWRRDAKAAIADFTAAMSIDPQYYFAAFNRGLTYGLLSKNTEALADFTKAIEISPTNPAPYYSRGVVYQRLKKYGESISDLSKVISLNDKHSDAYAQRAFGYYSQSVRKTDPQIALARADAEKALTLNPKQPYALAVRGVLKHLDKDYEGAYSDLTDAQANGLNVDWVKNAIKDSAQNSPSIREKVRATKLPEAKNKLEANIWDYQEYLRLNEVFDLADRFGDDKLARNHWESLIASNPKNVCAFRMLGDYKGAQNWREMTNFLVDGLNHYDGKNGAECAAEIAFRVGREYSDHLQFVDADRYLNRAKEIFPKLKYIQQNIDANLAKQREHTRETTALANGVRRSKELEDKLDQYEADSKARRDEVDAAMKKIPTHWANFVRLGKAFNESANKTRADALKVQAEVLSVKQICDSILAKHGSKLVASQSKFFQDELAEADRQLANIDEMLIQLP